jgi:hypothetical protein
MSPSTSIIEVHPWVSYPDASQSATKVIIGSFPPKRFTKHTGEGIDNGSSIYKRDLWKEDADFFYGSADNSFLSLIAEALGVNYSGPADIDQLKEYLAENGWVVTDIVLEAIRNPKCPDSAADTDLRVITWNKEAILRIFSENKINTIFFTSNWVKKNFFKYVKEASSPDVSDCEVYTLISPSRQGLMSLKWAFEVLPIEEGEPKTDYRKRYYQTLLQGYKYKYTIKSGESVVGTFSYEGLRNVSFYNDDWVLRSDGMEWKQVIEFTELHSLMDINPPPPKHYWME